MYASGHSWVIYTVPDPSDPDVKDEMQTELVSLLDYVAFGIFKE